MADISKIKYKGVEYNIKPLMDSTPTQGSNNAVSSGGVWNKITNLKEELKESLGVEYSENLFDPEDVTLNKYFWSGDAITRELRDRDGYFASGLIDVSNYDEITINGCEVIGAYQENQTVISPSIQPQSTLFVSNTYTLDDSIKYIRVAGQIANIDSVYIRKPEFTIPNLKLTPEQEPDLNNVVRYDVEQVKTDTERTQARRNAGIPVDFIEGRSNLFTPSSATDGYGIWGDGANHAQEGRFASDYIDINDIQSVKVYGVAATYFYDVSKALLGRGDPISSESAAQTYVVPANTKYVRITGTVANKYSATVMDASISKYKILDLVIEMNQVSGLNEISVLFIGNSLTHDSVSYVPYILKTLFPEIKFTIHIFYNGGTTLATQYNRFVNNTASANYSICDNSYTWKTYWDIYDMKTVLETYKFDIICMQDYFTFRSTFTEADLEGWNNCQAYIAANYKGGNPLKFVTLMPAPVRDNWTSQTHPTTAEVYASTVAAMKLVIKNTVAEAIIPCGYGIYKAMSTSLDELGDMGHLSHDGLHAQEGIPCLLQAYIVTLWILKELALPKSIYASPIRITTAIFNALNVPGSNVGTGVITGTDAQNLLAQEIAIQSHKEVGWWDFTA